MATFSGLLATPLRPFNYGEYSRNLDSMVLDQSPGRGARWLNPAVGPYAREGNPDVYHTTRSGTVTPVNLRYIYNRIMVFPQTIDLGNIVSQQTEQVFVWNAYLESRTLVSVAEAESQGVTLSGQPIPPLEFKALEELTWIVNIVPDGAPVVDTALSWLFDNDEVGRLLVTATRVQVWPFRPNWEAGQGVLERLEWLTSLQVTPLGLEQRRSMRISPRRDMQVQTIALGDERRYMELAVANWGARSWAVPVWPDVQKLGYALRAGDTEILCKTAGYDFHEGGMLLLRGRSAFDLETLQVDQVLADRLVLRRAVQADWHPSTYLYPARAARFVEQPTMRQLTDSATIAEVRFQMTEVCDWEPTDIDDFTMYLGYPVLLTRPEVSQDVTSTYVRVMQMLDNGSDLPGFADTAGVSFTAVSHRFDPVGREQVAAFRSLLYFLRGRWRSIWVPTFRQDLTIVRETLDTDVAISVRNVSYAKFGRGMPGKRDIRIERRAAPDLFFRIEQAVVDDEDRDVELLTLDRPVGLVLKPADVIRVSFMARCRLDQDFVELNHVTVDGEVFANATFRSLRDDL